MTTAIKLLELQNEDDDESEEAIFVCYLMLTLLIVNYDQKYAYATKRNIWPHEVYKLLVTKVHLVKAMVFPVVMYGCERRTIRKLSIKELILLNCGVGEDSWEFLGLQGDPTSPS